jgi:hypothetical protein
MGTAASGGWDGGGILIQKILERSQVIVARLPLDLGWLVWKVVEKLVRGGGLEVCRHDRVLVTELART